MVGLRQPAEAFMHQTAARCSQGVPWGLALTTCTQRIGSALLRIGLGADTVASACQCTRIYGVDVAVALSSCTEV